MKAQEKAKELFNKYCYAIRTEETDSGYFSNVIYAKDCALIAVDEIIENNPFRDYGFKFDSVSSRLDAVKEFWQEVKKELEQL